MLNAYLLGWNVKCDRAQIDFCVRVNAGNNEKPIQKVIVLVKLH